MVALSIPKLYTVDDLVALPSDIRVELIRGELISMPPPPGFDHGEKGNLLASRASVFVDDNNLGRCTQAETGFLIARNPDTVIAPDWAFIAASRFPVEKVRGYLPLAPDIVLEVRSPSDTPREVTLKVERWLAAGTRIVWELNPKTQIVAFHREGETQLLGPDDTLDGSDVLPGFTFDLRRLFPATDNAAS